MTRLIAHLLGTAALGVVGLMWLSLLDARMADRVVDSLFGAQNEYKVVLGAGMVATVMAFIAALRGAKWWFVAVALALGTLGFFTFALS